MYIVNLKNADMLNEEELLQHLSHLNSKSKEIETLASELASQ